MKRIKAILFLLALSLIFVACGDKEKISPSPKIENNKDVDPIEEDDQAKEISQDNSEEETEDNQSLEEEIIEDTEESTDEASTENAEENNPEQTKTEIDPELTYLDSIIPETKQPVVIKEVNTRAPSNEEVLKYLAEFAEKVRNGDPALLNYLVWPEDSKEKEELARIKIASTLNDKDAKALWMEAFKDFKIIHDTDRIPFNITGKKEDAGKSRFTAFILNQINNSLITTLSTEELAEFSKKYPYREYNISDKDTLLPIYKDILNKNADFSSITIDGRPLEVGDFNGTGDAAIDGIKFMESNVFYFPTSIDKDTKKVYWDFYSLERISEFIPFELNEKDDKELIAYKDLYTQGKLTELYNLILKNSEEKGFSFREDSDIRYSIEVAEKHYKKLGILPRMLVTTYANTYGEKKRKK